MDDGDASYINNEEDTITLMSISKYRVIKTNFTSSKSYSD